MGYVTTGHIALFFVSKHSEHRATASMTVRHSEVVTLSKHYVGTPGV